MSATTTYKRKRISNLDDLDREEARLRKKTKKIEKEWVELLNPQQLAIDFALGFVTNKVMGKGSPLKFVTSLFSSKKKKAANKATGVITTTAGKSKKNKVGKILKGMAIGLAAIQAIRLFAAYKRKKKEQAIVISS